MAEKRGSRSGNDRPADPARAADSKLRLVNPEAVFPEPDLEPDDDSPTIISKLPIRDDSKPGREKSDLRGRKLAHFELIEAIGVGGMAAVLRARDSQLDRFVALKILPPESADPENVRRFHQEARAAAKLDHENIARVFFCGEDQGLHFIAFEFVEGDNLRKVLERRGILPVGESIRYVLQVAAGLEHAASRGVVHRDIKPSNIIIMPDGRAKVVDMGLARSLEPHGDGALTQSGVTLGTFDYISPEQALEPREADCRSDIYSLGCTLYHMLTGQPPVPEGTAAKKLQHHQHVAPVDPRQINPEVPDDVARILGKMMAKNPRDRYQRPAHLMQDLMHASQALGDDSSQSQFYFDVQTPTEPRRRPMLLLALAAAALAGVLFLLSFANPPQPKRNLPPQAALPPRNVLPAVKTNPDLAPKTVSPVAIRNEDDLQRALDRAPENERLSIALDSDIVLSGKLRIAGTPRSRPLIEIVGPDRQPVRLVLNLDKAPTASVAGFRIDGANVNFRNIRFEVVADIPTKKLDAAVAAVAINGSSVVDFERCAFAQSGLPIENPLVRAAQGSIPAASLLVTGPLKTTSETAKITLRECYFPTGQDAIALAGAAKLTARDCAFHTLGTLFHLRGDGEPVVVLEHCSAQLHHGSAFRIDADTACRLKLDYCIFSVPDKLFRPGEKPNLLSQADSSDTSRVVYQGQMNRFHNLNSLWLSGSSHIIGVDDLNAFRKAIAVNKGFDTDSLILPLEPPPFLKAAVAKIDDIFNSFQLDDSIRDLHMPREKYDAHPVVGIRQCLNVALPRLSPLVVDTPVAVNDYKPAANEKVVDPDHTANLPGYYDSLAKALAAVAPGDVITLRAGAENAPFAIKPTDLESDLTVRGFPGTFPTLTLADTRISDAALFRLLDGTLHLENLHLVLEPSRDGFVSQSIVSVVGGGTTSLKNCTITLKPRDRTNPKQTPLSVVTALASEDVKMMMSDTKLVLPTPVVSLHDCFVRGDGDLVTLRGSRPATVKVNHSLLYLGGSLIHQMQASAKESANPDAPIAVRMKDSAFFFVDPLFWLQAGKVAPRHLHPLRIEQADTCLFATLADRPLVVVEGPEATEKTLAQLFEWKGQGNAFVHFDMAYLLEYIPADDTLRAVHIDETTWKGTIERDGDARFLPMGFKTLPARPLALRSLEDAVIHPDATDELQPYLSQLPRFNLPKN